MPRQQGNLVCSTFEAELGAATSLEVRSARVTRLPHRRFQPRSFASTATIVRLLGAMLAVQPGTPSGNSDRCEEITVVYSSLRQVT
jgi:hypothetical protein